MGQIYLTCDQHALDVGRIMLVKCESDLLFGSDLATPKTKRTQHEKIGMGHWTMGFRVMELVHDYGTE